MFGIHALVLGADITSTSKAWVSKLNAHLLRVVSRSTTQIYTHVLNRGRHSVPSSLDRTG